MVGGEAAAAALDFDFLAFNSMIQMILKNDIGLGHEPSCEPERLQRHPRRESYASLDPGMVIRPDAREN
jgi:hypothetical protein